MVPSTSDCHVLVTSDHLEDEVALGIVCLPRRGVEGRKQESSDVEEIRAICKWEVIFIDNRHD